MPFGKEEMAVLVKGVLCLLQLLLQLCILDALQILVKIFKNIQDAGDRLLVEGIGSPLFRNPVGDFLIIAGNQCLQGIQLRLHHIEQGNPQDIPQSLQVVIPRAMPCVLAQVPLHDIHGQDMFCIHIFVIEFLNLSVYIDHKTTCLLPVP